MGCGASQQALAAGGAASAIRPVSLKNLKNKGPPAVWDCAVSLKWLRQFALSVPESYTTAEVTDRIIKPATAETRCRYADSLLLAGSRPPSATLGSGAPSGRPNSSTSGVGRSGSGGHGSCTTVGPSHFFISHRWGCRFRQDLVAPLLGHFGLPPLPTKQGADKGKKAGAAATAAADGIEEDEDYDDDEVEDVFVWLDIFAVNQHPGASQSDDLANLHAVIQRSSATLMVLDPPALVLTRIWCLYEAWKTAEHKGASGLLLLAYGQDFDALSKTFRELDVAQAQATVEADRRRILADIDAGLGVQELNAYLKRAIVDGAVAEAQAAMRAPAIVTLTNSNSPGLGALRCASITGPVAVSSGRLMAGAAASGTARSSSVPNLNLSRFHVGSSNGAAPASASARVGSARNGVSDRIGSARAGPSARVGSARAGPSARAASARAPAAPITASEMRAASGQAGQLCVKAGRLLQYAGRYDESEEWLRAALALQENSRGPDHPNVAACLNLLGLLLKVQGKYAEAEPLYRRALEVRERSQEPGDAPDAEVAQSCDNLGVLLHEQGRLQEAEPLLRRAHAIRSKLFRPDHPEVAHSLNNVASLMQDQGRLQEAEQLYRQALTAFESALGPNHPNVAASLNNLASLLCDLGKYAEAEGMYRRAAKVWETALGPDHPDVATCLHSLAARPLCKLNRLPEAQVVLERALCICDRSLGSAHALTITVTRSLEAVRSAQMPCELADESVRSP